MGKIDIRSYLGEKRRYRTRSSSASVPCRKFPSNAISHGEEEHDTQCSRVILGTSSLRRSQQTGWRPSGFSVEVNKQVGWPGDLGVEANRQVVGLFPPVLKFEDTSSSLRGGRTTGIKFGLATHKEICAASISDGAISHASRPINWSSR